jgi:hypothetical protein
MRREKLHQHVNDALLMLDYLESNIERTNDLARLQRNARDLRRSLLQIKNEVLDYTKGNN